MLNVSVALAMLAVAGGAQSPQVMERTWMIGPFVRDDAVNPILEPKKDSMFQCPVSKKPVAWEHDHVFNPAAAVFQGKVFVLYRAEDDSGEGIGKHTSRIGIADSEDGHHFQRSPNPVLYPTEGETQQWDWPGGCEDPRIVASDKGFVMTYTSWNRKTARLSVATSPDLVHWQKHGPVFAKAYKGKYLNDWSKSGSIVAKVTSKGLTATKINGKYWMYWGEGKIGVATSTNLVDWTPVEDAKQKLVTVFGPRKGKFDSNLAEPGPPAVITDRGIVFIYNGKNADTTGDKSLSPGAYAAGQALLDKNDPTKLIDRSTTYFFKPERPYEVTGQYASGTVFVEGLVWFKGKWKLYYGTADSKVAMASTP